MARQYSIWLHTAIQIHWQRDSMEIRSDCYEHYKWATI